MEWVWDHYKMKNLHDLLKWYNDLDVEPFVDAIITHRTPFEKIKLDTFTDGVSLQGIAEKVVYNLCYENLPERLIKHGSYFDFLMNRFDGYKKQDKDAGREFGLTTSHIQYLLSKQSFVCEYCLITLTDGNASADRIDNKKGHVDSDIVMTCISCNVARKDMDADRFKYSKLIEYNSDRLIYSIDEEHKEVYQCSRNQLLEDQALFPKDMLKLMRRILGILIRCVKLLLVMVVMRCT